MIQYMRQFLSMLLVLTASLCWFGVQAQPNIIFIFSDDLMAITDAIGGGSQIIAPNIQRLKDRGVTFERACANATVCGPSRASVFTGVLPNTSGHFGYRMGVNSWFNNPVLSETTTMFSNMKSNGYSVYGLGKIFHKSDDNASDFNILNNNNPGPKVSNGIPGVSTEGNVPPLPGVVDGLDPTLYGTILSLSELENYPGYDWYFNNGTPFTYIDENNRSLFGDEQITQQAVAILNSVQNSPFFLTLGYRSPHTPLYAPDSFYDLYNFGSLELSTLIPEDSRSFPIASEKNRWNFEGGYNDYKKIQIANMNYATEDYLLRKVVHGYYALVSFLDHQIGVILDELDASPYADNTVIILSSDHGYHLGDKLRLRKTTLWNKSALVPMIISGPGIAQGEVCTTPVSLIDVYPTILELSGVQQPFTHTLDGTSMVPLLQNPEGSWDGSPYALTAVACDELIPDNVIAEAHHQHYSLMSETMHYNYYSSGEEELYSYLDDPRELYNLLYSPKHQSYLNEFRNYISTVLDGKVEFAKPYQNLYYGDFSQKLNGWKKGGSPNVTATITENPSASEIEYVATINAPSTSYTFVNKNIRLSQNRTYQLCLNAKAVAFDGNIIVRIVRDTEEDSTVLHSFSIAPTGEWAKYCFEFTEVLNDDPYSRRLEIKSTGTGSFQIANISVEDVLVRTSLSCNAENAQVLIPGDTPSSSAATVGLSFVPSEIESPCTIIAQPAAILTGWFKFTAPAKEVNIWAKGNQDFVGGIELYQACNTPAIACTAGNNPGLKSVLVATSLTIGAEYLVRIFHNSLTYVSDTLIQAGVLRVPATSVSELTCNNLNLSLPYELQLVPLSNYDNLVKWQLEITNLTNQASPVVYDLPGNIPPVFNISNPNIYFQPNKTYKVRARAIMYEGPILGQFSTPCIFQTFVSTPTIGSNFSIDLQNLPQDDAEIYPNPMNSDSQITLTFNQGESELHTVEIFDQLGRKVAIDIHSAGHAEMIVTPHSSLAAGAYFVVVKGSAGSVQSLPLMVLNR